MLEKLEQEFQVPTFLSGKFSEQNIQNVYLTSSS